MLGTHPLARYLAAVEYGDVESILYGLRMSATSQYVFAYRIVLVFE
jgi:hypothetical protein